MKYWNHRVLMFKNEHESWYAVHEVYYDGNDKPVAYREGASAVHWPVEEGDAMGAEILEQIGKALTKPVLLASDFDTKEG